MNATSMRGYPRADGRVGIRNVTAVVYLVECAHHVATRIAAAFSDTEVHTIGFGGCFPNSYAFKVLERLCTHPNVSSVLLVSLGCEGFDRDALSAAIGASGRQVRTLVIQESGGTRTTIEAGQDIVRGFRRVDNQLATVPIGMSDLIVGTICGGSDSTSGITANPAVGLAFDELASLGARVIFEETGELIGCEDAMALRATTPELGHALRGAVAKAAEYYTALGHGSFAPGNAEGGLTTIEEKSLGAYAKSGTAPIVGLLKPGDVPTHAGTYLLDIVPDGPVRWGFPNINDNAEAAELMACGAHLILFTTGRGSVVGSAISPIVKVCANPQTYQRMSDDMDINAGKILDGGASLRDVGTEIVNLIADVASGQLTASEALGHREFVLTYKTFSPVGPACLPTG